MATDSKHMLHSKTVAMLRKLHDDDRRVLTAVPYKDTPQRLLTYKSAPSNIKFAELNTKVQVPRMELTLLRNLTQQTNEQLKSWHKLSERSE